MKGNFPGAFLADDHGVSPVVGSIVLFGIAAVLAAGVAVIVSVYVDDRPEEDKAAAFLKDESADRIQIARADPTMDWSLFSIDAVHAVRFGLNQDAGVLTGSTGSRGSFVPISSTSVPFTASDYVDFCVVGPSAKDVQVYLRNDMTNRLYARFTFGDVAPCLP